MDAENQSESRGIDTARISNLPRGLRLLLFFSSLAVMVYLFGQDIIVPMCFLSIMTDFLGVRFLDIRDYSGIRSAYVFTISILLLSVVLGFIARQFFHVDKEIVFLIPFLFLFVVIQVINTNAFTKKPKDAV
ncbi:MAG: hypothetical protein WAN35_10025 [Terracidiphilus sp.]